MEPLLQNECIVSTPLAFVLFVSKILGIAAVKLEQAPKGWRITASRGASVYGRIIIVVATLALAVAFVWDCYSDQDRTIYLQSKSQIVAIMMTASTGSVVVLSEAYFGLNRMQQTIASFSQLQKIIAKLKQYEPVIFYRKTEWFLILIGLVLGNINVAVNSVELIDTILNNGDDIIYIQFLYMAFQIEIVMMNVLILQIALIHLNLMYACYQLNGCLESLWRRMWNGGLDPMMVSKNQDVVKVKNNYINTKRNAIDHLAAHEGKFYLMPATVHCLGAMYCSISEVVTQVNECNGFELIAIITAFLLHFIITPYNLFLSIYGEEPDFYASLHQMSWVVYHTCNMFMIIEPCHHTYEQMIRTRYLISQVMRYTPMEQHSLMSELELFYKHLMAKEVVYAPMNMFTLNRSIITTILGSITTYLVVIIQM